MKKSFIGFIIPIALLFSINLYARTGYKFHTFSPEGGFYYDGIKRIKQDKKGFIWIMMDNEIFRFDGYQYERYYTQFQNLNKNQKWTFRHMITDTAGHILVMTNSGLFGYDPSLGRFEQLSSHSAPFIYADDRNQIWINDSTLAIFDKATKEITRPKYRNKSLYNIIAFHSRGSELYVASYHGDIYRYDYDKQEFFLFCTFPGSILDMKQHQNSIWVLTGTGLHEISKEDSSICRYYELKEYHQLFRTFLFDKNDQVWIGTMDGVIVMDPDDGSYTSYRQGKNDSFGLPNNSIWTIDEDNKHNIWIGTYSGGLCYVNLNENNAFESVKLRDQIISSFAEDESTLWVSTEGGGISRYDKKKGIYYFRHRSEKAAITSNNVKNILTDHHNNLWVATYRGGLNKLDPRSGTIRNFKNDKKDRTSLYNDNLRKIVLEADSGLWVAYQVYNTVISFFSFRTESFTHYYFDRADFRHFIFDMQRDNNDRLWIACHSKLYCMDIRTGDIKSVNDSLHLNAQTIHIADDIIWLGTIGKGLIRYDPADHTFRIFDDILKFNATSIYSLCTDNSQNLWMGTDNGLFKFDVLLERFYGFDKGDGLQGQVYYPLSCMKGLDGKLYFGGTNGYSVIDPAMINENFDLPEVIISGFFLDNQPISIYKEHHPGKYPKYESDLVELDYNQSNFGFSFSSDNYLMPEKNRFRYRLKGYDDRWIETDASNRTAFYSKVPAGEYLFEVMAANNDGIWNDNYHTIRIKKQPAPWFSLPAYIIYSMIFLSIVYIIIRYYRRQKELKMILYKEGLEKQKQEEIHQTQLKFFTNISHDFRTPLSLIMASLDCARGEGLKEKYYHTLYNNSQRLLHLINELLDFQTVENGKMPLNVSPTDINRFVGNLADDFTDYALRRNIRYNISYNDSLTEDCLMDKQVGEKIILNLLNNAFKYTQDGGYVSIGTLADSAQFEPVYKNSFRIGTCSGNTYAVVVRDNGVGISAESIKHVFDRFYKVQDHDQPTHLGSGVGLALVKSLVLLHKGRITIYSEREKGSDIVVEFPRDKNTYLKEEIRPAGKENRTAPQHEADTEAGKENADSSVIFRDKKRILVVEDNNELRSFISEYLSKYYETVEAPNGKTALELIDKMEIDMVISDIMMPHKDGISLCQDIKDNINISHIAVILLTSKTGVDSRIEGTNSGADSYLEKPVNFDLLLSNIRNIFRHREQLKEYYAKNHFADISELSDNHENNKFLKQFVDVLDRYIDRPELDVNFVASELSMSRSKLYAKIKSLTGKSIVEFTLNYRLRKAARLIIEENRSMAEVMTMVGIESQSYFSRAFKKEFGETPTAFVSRHKKSH